MRTIFLRDPENGCTVSSTVSANTKEDFVEIRSAVDLRPYTNLILQYPGEAQAIYECVDELYNLREWLWEWRLPNKNSAKEYQTILDEVRTKYAAAAKDINEACETFLFVVED